jgi:hypothetical protein
MKKVKNTGISFFQRDGVNAGNISITRNNTQKSKLSRLEYIIKTTIMLIMKFLRG